MSVCRRSLLAFVLIMLSPVPLIMPMLISDSNVDLGSVGNMFNMLCGNVDNFLFLAYFCGYDASYDPYSRT